MSLLPPTPAKRVQQEDKASCSSSAQRAGKDLEHLPAKRLNRGSYLQRWSALSNKGVSFSRNSKAELTSSVKSCKDSETPSWVLCPPAHPQGPSLSAGSHQHLAQQARKQAATPTSPQEPGGEMVEAPLSTWLPRPNHCRCSCLLRWKAGSLGHHRGLGQVQGRTLMLTGTHSFPLGTTHYHSAAA